MQGENSVVSQGTYLCAGTHDYQQPDMPLLRPPITIGRGVWIAAQAFIGPGVTVDRISIVFDEGQDTGTPDNFGAAFLDNIDVNGTLIGKPGAAK